MGGAGGHIVCMLSETRISMFISKKMGNLYVYLITVLHAVHDDINYTCYM